MKHPLIDQQIAKVTYFELNNPEQVFYFSGFDNFDLALELECVSGERWHIGWTENERFEVASGPYVPPTHISGYVRRDAHVRWLPFLEKRILEVEILYVNEEEKIPAKVRFLFEDGQSATILLAEELNLDGTLPLPLRYGDLVEIYVFFGEDVPPFEWVRWDLEYPTDEVEPKAKTRVVSSQRLVGAFLILLIVALLILALAMRE